MYDEFNDKEQNNVTGGTPSNSGEGYRQDEVYEQSDAQPSNENMVYDADETADTIESPETSETADTAEEQAYAQPDNQMTSSQNQNGQAQNNSFYHYAYDRDNRQEEEQQQDQQGQQQHSYGSYQTGGQNPNPPRYEKPKKKKIHDVQNCSGSIGSSCIRCSGKRILPDYRLCRWKSIPADKANRSENQFNRNSE
ncbi:MAG: hypothetical protein RHS_1971 [Robinsoniella sp. RHS]|uniref:hypothetical protein n=1 Tax=Robinsoniella sp. RHS TaxID=1504536 RepID=UPI0006592FB9|nr:MAG: hypothetical protein RHS_1971 [Robinsoniella sp. RHS]